MAIDNIEDSPFGANPVYLGEATTKTAALALIDPDEYDATHRYFFVDLNVNVLIELTAITLPTAAGESYSYELLNPGYIPPQTATLVCSMGKPSGGRLRSSLHPGSV